MAESRTLLPLSRRCLAGIALHRLRLHGLGALAVSRRSCPGDPLARQKVAANILQLDPLRFRFRALLLHFLRLLLRRLPWLAWRSERGFAPPSRWRRTMA